VSPEPDDHPTPPAVPVPTGPAGRPRVLLVREPGAQDDSASEPVERVLVGALGEVAEMVVARTPAEALDRLGREAFAGVISESGGFGLLSRESADTEVDPRPKTDVTQALLASQASRILDLLGEGVVIVEPDGRCRWMNRRMQQWPPAVHEQVRRACTDALRHYAHLTLSPSGTGPRSPSRRVPLTVGDERFLEVIASPVVDAQGRCRQVIAVVVDATGTRRLQQKIDAIDKAGAELVKIESEAVEAMTLAERLKLLEQKVVRVTRDLMHFDHFNVRLVDPRHGRLELVVSNGLPPEASAVQLVAEADANGISGYVADTGKSYICPDVTADGRYVAGLDGARSSLTVPLTLDDQIIGVFNIESRRLAAFNEDDRQFAEIFGRYVAIALSILKLLVHERVQTNKKLTDDFASEIVGPVNDITLDCGQLLDEYGDDADLRERLSGILRNAEGIRASLRQAASGPQTVLGTREFEGGVEPAPDPDLEGARVLVVDDEASIRDVVAAVLRKYRITVTAESNAQAAIDRLSGDGPAFDLVLSDIRMPDKSGYDVFDAARQRDPAPPVILMTGFGYDPNHCIVRASQEGLHSVLFKPFRVEQLIGEVRRAVAIRVADTP
jgi:CheY-like chemotaxis protein/PAS domain-containing protein